MTFSINRDTVLIEYINKGDLEGVKDILADGANANAVSGVQKRTPLIYAVSLRDVEPRVKEEIIEWLLCYDARPETSDIDGWTPLHSAVSVHDIESAKALLKKNPDILHLGLENGTTPLHSAIYMAVSSGKTDFISFLLEQGADPLLADKSGKTPFGIAQTHAETLIHGKKIIDCFIKPEVIKQAFDEAAYRVAVDAQLARIKLKRPNVKFTK